MGKVGHPKFSRRATLVGASCLLVACAGASNISARPTTVLFVCQFGTVKSPIAREMFRRQAARRGVLVQVGSRGITPEDHISPALLEALDADGFDIRSEPVRALARSDLAEADIIVLFDPLPATFGTWTVRDWSDLPSMNANYAASRDVLISRINSLLNEIETNARTD